MIAERKCRGCEGPMPKLKRRGMRYCGKCGGTRQRPAPAVYRFICPDGRSYVGSVKDHRRRGQKFARRNRHLDEVFKTHPPETWTFEILEKLPAGCSVMDQETAEQRHIDRLRSTESEFGFNVRRADTYVFAQR